MFPRYLVSSLLEALGDTPVVCLIGARQSGKTTLVRSLISKDHPARYLTFDDPSVLAAAHADPNAFLGAIEGPVVLDEVQRAPGLFRALKGAVDSDRRPGRFLLTGSADVLVLPEISRELVGRMEVLTLWPLSQGEVGGRRETFLDAVFAAELRGLSSSAPRPSVLERALVGGYPEIQTRAPRRRAAWFDSYLTTLLQRDVRDLAQIEGLATLPNLLEILAHRATTLLNFAEISRIAGMPQTTLKRYLALLENTFVLHTVAAWAKNPGKRLVKSPKLLFADSGLLTRVARWTPEGLERDRQKAGPLLENFVLMELVKQAGWTPAARRLFHFRTAAGHEVDAVIEDDSGRLVGIEVKASGTLGRNDFRGLESLREAAEGRFLRGIVLYAGEERLPFGPDLDALPLSSLWSG